MNYHNIRVIYIGAKEFAKQYFPYMKGNKMKLRYFERKKDIKYFGPRNFYVKQKYKSQMTVLMRYFGKLIECRIDLTGDNNKFMVDPVFCFRTFQQYHKVDEIPNADSYGSASPFLYKNEKYDGKRVYAYSYDMNSAYGWSITQPLPDINTMRKHDFVKEGEVGFIYDNDGMMIATFNVGVFCPFVCKLVPSEWIKFSNVWFKRKLKSACKEQRAKAKFIVNIAIGYLQHKNPFMRTVVVERVNQKIRSLVDENTIYANTDSIVSIKRRPDIEKNLGDDLGQFTLDKEGMFAWKPGKYDYQWDNDVPHLRGIPKGWLSNFENIHGRKFDILKDETPKNGNIYEIDFECYNLKEINYEKDDIL